MIEDLNRTQLILLTLLISFVTSIATGIITVSLLSEAPPSVTQTINRVVEKTIERVVPAEGSSGGTVREVTVVVKEEDLVLDAIEKNSKALVRIRDNALVDGVSPFYGIGFLANKDGLVVSNDNGNLNHASTYTASFGDGTSFSMKVAHSGGGLAFFKIVKDPKLSFPTAPVSFASEEAKLGQTVLSFEGQAKDVIGTGRVTSYSYDDTGKLIVRINSDITVKTPVLGGPLVNLSGEVVGVRTSGADPTETYVSLVLLKQGLANVPKN